MFASDAGYGFITKLQGLTVKTRTGRALLTLPEGTKAITPARIIASESSLTAVVTQQGRLLIFPVSEIPVLGRGKGNKLIQILPAEFKAHEDSVVSIASVSSNGALRIIAGKRVLTLKSADWGNYFGDRGRRGQHLPRGFQRVERLEVVDETQ